jgi:hypothetical protein
MSAPAIGNSQFQAFVKSQASPSQPQQPSAPSETNPADVFIASIVGADDQKACGYGGSGGGGCR